MKPISHHRRIAGVFALLPLTAILGACATISTGSHFDKTTNFGAYASYSWIDDSPSVVSENSIIVSPKEQSKITAEIQRQLEHAGYSFNCDRDAADFVVGFTVGTRAPYQSRLLSKLL